MKSFNVLVTGMGGNVGEGVAKSLARNFPDQCRIIGTNIEYPVPGQIFVDKLIKIPHASSPDYVSTLKRVCDSEAIDIVLPTTDLECLILSEQIDYFEPQTIILTNSYQTQIVFNDKYLTSMSFRENGIPFSDGVLPKDYRNQWREIIVKPRDGRGSRNISFNPPNMSAFDDKYVVQPLLKGPEVTTALFYGKRGEVIGPFSFVRTLSSGATTTVQTYDDHIDAFKAIGKKIKESYSPKGSINIQSIITEEGPIPFEINGRLSGTTGLRDYFGFQDTLYSINSYLLNLPIEPATFRKGCAVRALKEYVFLESRLDDVKKGSKCLKL